jgi:hypothetical protein
MTLRSTVIALISELLEEEELPVPELGDDTVLLESGLDSLGFAVLVTRLEEAVGYDPFSLVDEPVYPTTLGEFVDFYEAHAPEASQRSS